MFHRHKCHKCGEEFSSKAKLNAHSKLHVAQEKAALKCTIEVRQIEQDIRREGGREGDKV